MVTLPHFQDEATVGAYERLLLRRIFEPWGRLLLDRAELPEGGRVLDVATGPGTIARMAAKELGPRGRVDAVDVSAQMLAEARSKGAADGAPIEYTQAPADALPFPAGTFDRVTCQQGLQFFPDQAAALREMRRVLKPGGRVAIAMWADDHAMTLFVAFLEAFDSVNRGAPRKPLAWLDASRLTALLQSADLSGVKVEEATLVAPFEQGFREALACVDGTSVGAGVRALSPDDRRAFDEKVAEALRPYAKGEALQVPARALVAVARA
jgi:SAM-dependent methyltransferase